MEKRFNDGFTNEKANAAYSECVRDAYKCAENYKKSVLGKNYRDTDYADKGLSRAQIEALTEADKFLSGDSPLSAPEKQWATIKNRYVKSEVQPAKENNIIK